MNRQQKYYLKNKELVKQRVKNSRTKVKTNTDGTDAKVETKVKTNTTDYNFNVYYEYNLLNVLMHKQQFNPFLIWYLKIQEVNTVYNFKTQHKLFKLRYALVMEEFLKYDEYPKIVYERNHATYNLKTPDGLTSQYRITVPIKQDDITPLPLFVINTI